MSSGEPSILPHFGIVTTFNLSNLIAMTLLYGILLLVTCISTAILLNRKPQTRATRMGLVTTVFSFLLATLQWGTMLAGLLLSIRSALINDPDKPLDYARLQAINTEILFPVSVITNWTSQILPLISDGVIVWRAWVLFQDRQWIMTGPVVLLLGSTATTIAYLVLTSSYAAVLADQQGDGQISTNIWNSSLGLSLATNLVATLLILYRLWQETRRSDFSVVSVGQRALAVLVESGAVFCLFQLAIMALSLSPFESLSPFDNAVRTIVSMYTIFCAMYPNIIFIIINCQQSCAETFGLVSLHVSTTPGVVDREGKSPAIPAAATRSALVFGMASIRSQSQDSESGIETGDLQSRGKVGEGNGPEAPEAQCAVATPC